VITRDAENRPKSSSIKGRAIRFLSFNMQVGIGASKPHHYLTHSWKHLIPHANHFHNLDQIASMINAYDIVGLQETDAGSFRSSFVSQPRYLAEKAGFPYYHVQTNRNLGHIARHSNSLLSQFDASEITGHRLPGRLPGRGALAARFGEGKDALLVLLLHLALGKKARMRQLGFIGDLVSEFQHIVVMGDLNCQPWSDEIKALMTRTGLLIPTGGISTFPSWSPKRDIDHFLVSPSLKINYVKALPIGFSDHLPIAMEVLVPESVQLRH